MRIGLKSSRHSFVVISPITAILLSPFLLIYAVLWLYAAGVVLAVRAAHKLAQSVKEWY